MKKVILLPVVVLCILLSGCFSVNEETSLEESQWKLIETRISIGGDAEYVSADREETITFLSNSRVRNSNGWCGEGSETVVTYSEDGIINTNCQGSGTLVFEMNDGFLIVRNPRCIEACDLKYEKVDNR